ncbi:SDR family oxidoreductase [Streptomyces bacillaris]|uniref:SDR family oxidoreductase n=1 Tax=Streptomyces TaxID=1883 RepID=UPI00116B3AC6|nr:MULTISPECIES: SDR family oxidoreductase [Streptomyces]TQO33035.1 NAD(P)-dependent dehydrogenase (short-subunit alcohol dehydrogenase family) [Streptomyces cavourensis]
MSSYAGKAHAEKRGSGNPGSGNSYEGRKAVVTGGTHGIGMAVVKALLAGGAEVLLTGLNEKNIEAARTELGAGAHVLRSDAASLADIDALGKTVEDTLGEVDFVFVNVGHVRFGSLGQVTEEAYDAMFDTNTKGAFFTAQRLAPLVKDGGSFVFTTAAVAGTAFVGTSAGTAMKAAIRAFSRVFASELLPRNIRVNTVSPGFTQTPTMGLVGISDEQRALNQREGERVTPMRRFGTPEEVAAAVLFLGFEATFTNGVDLPVDGGLAQGLEYPHDEVVTEH